MLTGEASPDFLPQETGKHSFLGCRVAQTFLLGNRTQARQWCEAGHSQLPREWTFEDFPDGRGGSEKQTLFALEGNESTSGQTSARVITFFEEHGCFLKEQTLTRQLFAGQGSTMYQTTLQATRKAPIGAKTKTIAEARETMRLQRETNCGKGALAGGPGGVIRLDDDESQSHEPSAEPVQESDTEPEQDVEDPLTAQALAQAGAAQQAASCGGIRSRTGKIGNKGPGKGGGKRGKGPAAGGASPNRKALTKQEETLPAAFRSLTKEIDYSEILKGWRLGKARYRARELTKRLKAGNSADEEA